uniref:Uncharacterized protein n=1 Tax=Ixodes ricinus TaxID=34613 RepID=A0A6B0U741_IXORI
MALAGTTGVQQSGTPGAQIFLSLLIWPCVSKCAEVVLVCVFLCLALCPGRTIVTAWTFGSSIRSSLYGMHLMNIAARGCAC